MSFESKLVEPRARFLARVVEHGFEVGVRTPDDFLRHFSPTSIMQAMADEPDRRARILQETIGLRPRIALKKSPASSGEDLQIAIEEGETDAATIVRLFHPDDRVRFLDPRLLWAYVIEPSHFGPEPARVDALRAYTVFIIEQALAEGIVTHREVVTGIGVPTLVDRLPREEVATLLERALEDGRQGTPFSDETLFELLSLPTLCAHVPLATLWTWVIAAKIATPLGLSPDERGDDLLFDEQEAHPDASRDVTVIIDGHETDPAAPHPLADLADDHG